MDRKSTIWFWALMLALIAQNTLDMMLLRGFTQPGAPNETFPMLAHTLRHWGLDASIWAIRGILYSFMYGSLLVKRAYPKSLPYLNDLLVAINAIYAAGMTDELFFLGILPTPKGQL